MPRRAESSLAFALHVARSAISRSTPSWSTMTRAMTTHCTSHPPFGSMRIEWRTIWSNATTCAIRTSSTWVAVTPSFCHSCAHWGTIGVGFDSSFIPGRANLQAGKGITIIQDYYSEAYAEHAADFVICRHVLDILPNPQCFLYALPRGP